MSPDLPSTRHDAQMILIQSAGRASRRSKTLYYSGNLIASHRTLSPRGLGAVTLTWRHDSPGRRRRRLRRRGALRRDVEGVQGLAPAHEQAVALGTAEADVGADLGKPDAADELALRRPDGHAAVAEPAPAGVAVAGDPHVALDVAARAVGAALDAVDHEIAEHFLVR